MGKQMKISEFEQLNSEQMNSSETIEISQEEDGILKSKRNPLSRLGNWINNTFNFNTLQTYNKNLVDGINEKREIRVGYYGGPAHNSVYRGKWLGTAPTEAQLDAIENGSFDDLYIGDFWSNSSDPTSNEIRWRIAGFNYFHNVGLHNEVLRNHAVIIPDTTLVQSAPSRSSNFYITQMGYKYNGIRGYSGSYGYIGGSGSSAYINNDTIHNIDTIPDYVSLVYISGFTIYDSNDQVIQSGAYGAFPIVDYGEDPENPKKGYIKFSSSNFMPLSNITIPKSQWGPKTFEYWLQNLKWYYCKYSGRGGLIEAKQIIFNTFGEEHVMKHETPLTYLKLTTNVNPYIPELSIQKEWTEVTVELPTMNMIVGNSSISCYSENKIEEYSFEISKPDNKPQYLNTNQKIYNQIRLPKNVGSPGFLNNHELGYANSNQLPLFLYDPALIHPGYNYWFQNICWHDDWSFFNNQGFSEHVESSFCMMDYWGRLTGWYGDAQQGLRPYFCLAKYNTPK